MNQVRRVVVLANDVPQYTLDGELPSYESQFELHETASAIAQALMHQGWDAHIVTVTDSVAQLGSLLAPYQQVYLSVGDTQPRMSSLLFAPL